MSQFDEKAATWDENPKKVKMAKEIAGAIIQSLPLNNQMSALEFGCGTGLVTTYIAEKVKSVTAVDNSAGMLAVLEQKIKTAAMSNIDIKNLDLTHEHTLEETFDIIYSVMALHHVKDYTSLLTYFNSILNPGGMIAIADLDDVDGTFHLDGSHVDYTTYERNDVKSSLINIGFTNLSDSTVFIFTKERASGIHKYPVFLITGRKT